ncbi:MAG: type II secretion system F family protein [Candidatus Pacebacteria bacterium]|jgi:type IV pilus assembly protein PilC|nr:type II secretion system F family protein [Candidatus Paceibacterota bacterium]
MLFKYKVVDQTGAPKEGSIDAATKDLAISSLQRRGFIVTSIVGEEEKTSILQMSFFEKIPLKDVVILSRQISTLFNAQVSALKAFTMLASSAENTLLARKLRQITDDLQAGTSISGALSKHPDTFSNFYVNMVRAGEESGKLNEVFSYLADYLNREYELTQKTKNALIYPAFVVLVFIAVMVLMFTMVIPKLSSIIQESGQAVPVYTQIVIGISNFFVNYGVFVVIFFVVLGLYLWRMSRTESGKTYLDSLKISTPVIGNLYRKLYLARISDNLDTMLSSGISIVRAIDISSDVVGNKVYGSILKKSGESVKEGSSLSDAFAKHEEMPPIMVQMVKVGEETGSLGSILKTLGQFYKREVDDAVDTLVGLIEPIMIVLLGLGVGVLLTSVLVPIYNIAGGIQ